MSVVLMEIIASILTEFATQSQMQCEHNHCEMLWGVGCGHLLYCNVTGSLIQCSQVILHLSNVQCSQYGGKKQKQRNSTTLIHRLCPALHLKPFDTELKYQIQLMDKCRSIFIISDNQVKCNLPKTGQAHAHGLIIVLFSMET